MVSAASARSERMAAAPRCAKGTPQEMRASWFFSRSSSTRRGARAKPTRKPVMEKALETPPSQMTCSAASRMAGDDKQPAPRKSSSKTISPYISSETRNMPRAIQRRINASIISGGITLPVGLLGEQMYNTFVLAVIAASISARSGKKPRSGVNPYFTGVAPNSREAISTFGQSGSGSRISSPVSRVALSTAERHPATPTLTSTSSATVGQPDRHSMNSATQPLVDNSPAFGQYRVATGSSNAALVASRAMLGAGRSGWPTSKWKILRPSRSAAQASSMTLRI
mmetsp:Transcript_117078/g.372808  ORF Transcript_117078/g.372808 Transcript_117078/m.372808 type:complete len:283 (+) Transcript_117078:372-1220(+)